MPPPAAGPEAVVAAAAEVLGTAEFRANARRAAEQMAAMPSPREVADQLASALH